MGSVGVELKAAREKKNISLREVAATTRISHTNLELLEEGRYNDLPGGVYNRAFIRAYCEFLGLECKEMLARYEVEIAPPSDKTTRAKEKTRLPSEPLIRPHPLAAWGFMLLVSIVGLYFSRHWISGVFSPYFAHSPASKMTAVQAPSAPPESKPPAAPASAAPGASTAPSPVAMPTSSAGQPVSATQSDTVVPPPPPVTAKVLASSIGDKPSATPRSLPPGKIRLEFQATEKCWMSVNSDGNRSIVKILEPGERSIFDADERFFLVLGNAGGIRLSINGKPTKSLGKSGQVSRVLINAQTMKDLIQNSPN